MKVEREGFLKILTAVRPGLARKQILEEATHFIFTRDDIMTYNDQVCIVHPFETDFICSVSANEFYKIITGINAKEITLELEEGKLKIQGGKTKASLATSTADEIMSMIKALDLGVVMKKLTSLPEDFLQGATLCSFSASKDMTHPALTCLLIEDDLIMSSDDLRISQYQMKKAMDCSVLIPAAAITELVKFPVIDYCVSGGWVYFATKEDVMFCCRTVDAKYNDYAKYFEGFEGIELDLPADLSKLVETASVLADGEYDTDKLIEIEVEKGKIRCKGSSAIGWIENETDMAFKRAEKIKFAINPLFLINILNHSAKMIYKENRALFDGGNFQHLMALKVD